MEGNGCHPVGARIARPSRPLCSDRREGRCRLVGRDDSARHPCVIVLSGERARARFFAPRCSAQNDKSAVIPRCTLSSVILRSAATKDPARARHHRRHLHRPRDDPSVTACGRASSPQRGAGDECSSLPLARAVTRAEKFRLERRLHTNGGRRPDIASSPRPRGRAQNAAGAALPQTCNVCGRVHPPSSFGGGDPQEGVKTPSCPRGGRAGRNSARDARAIPNAL